MRENFLAAGRHLWMQRWRPHLLALAFYTALTVIALNTLVRHLATAVPAVEGWDYAIFYWDLWWVKYALFNLHRDPFLSNYVLYPNTANLSLHTLVFPLGLLSAPLQEIFDLKLIYNGLMVGCFIASGYLTFVFVRRHVQNDWIAALGGALFAFMPMSIARVSAGHLNLAQAWWLPLELILWDGVMVPRSMRSRIIAAAVLGLATYLAWTDDAQFMLLIGVLLAPYALFTWLTQCQKTERLRVIGLAFVAIVFMLGPALVEPIPALLQTRKLIFPSVDLYTLEFHSYQLGWLWSNQDRPGENMGQVLPLLTLMSLPLAGQHRRRWFWLALGVGLFILALGPYLHGTRIPLPYLLVHKLMGEQYRTPLRLTLPASLALVMFVGLSLANLFDRMPQRWQPWLTGAATVGLVFNSGLLAPVPVTFLPDYRIYHEIGRDPAEYALLEVPVGPASGFGEFGDSPDLQFYAYIHHKQLINGIVSRVPSDGLSRFERSPVLRGLTGEYDMPPLNVAGNELADKLHRWDMRYVLVHLDRLQPERARAIVEFLNVQPMLCLVDEEGSLLAYRRINAWGECPRPEMGSLPGGKNRLVLGDPTSARYVGPGWYDVEDIGGQPGRWAGEIAVSTLRLVPPPGSHRIRFRAVTYPADQTVTVSVNGQTVGAAKLSDDWAVYEFDIPADASRVQGSWLVEMTHARLESAFERTDGKVEDKRPLGAAYDYFAFEP